MVELVAPLGHGQRALIAGPPGSGATVLLRELRPRAGAGRRAGDRRARRRAPRGGARSGRPAWRSRPPTRAARRASRWRSPRTCSARAKRAAERGEDAVLLLDSLSRLARAYGLARGDRVRGGRGDQALVRGRAGRRRGPGSLTLIAAARVESESSFEALVHEALEDSADMVVRLELRAGRAGPHPAIDVDALAHAGGGGADGRGPPPHAREHARRGALARRRSRPGSSWKKEPGALVVRERPGYFRLEETP